MFDSSDDNYEKLSKLIEQMSELLEEAKKLV